ncbi:NADH:ubiquinone oxidoreductase [Patescibacteria group bacterium]|nr:NADH:ubiquinone oxidoreductase [Patescibacteria group bacterium]
MTFKHKKPKIAIVGLTCCEGCEFAVLDLGQKVLDLARHIDFVEFRMIKEDPKVIGPYDICFVEGSAVTKQNRKQLMELREKSKLMIVLGNCADTGGIHQMKSFAGKDKLLKMVYKNPKGIENSEIEPISNLVKVDHTIPGCPITAEEFLNITYQLLSGLPVKLLQNPVCWECQINGYECLLQKGDICVGPITLAGCDAVCLKGKQACWGCRGLIEEPDVTKFVTMLWRNHPLPKIFEVLEVFGIKDNWQQEALKEELIEQKEKRKKTNPST